MTLSYQVSWLDIYNHAKSQPNDFTLTTLPDGTRCCQFICKGFKVEISEDDWRFISSGALNRIPLEHPLEEDETAELATLDILEQRSSTLFKKADEVAARARILNHKLGQRKADIYRRRQMREGSVEPGFQPVNQPMRTPQSSNYDLHQDLLQQFLSTPPSSSQSRSASTISQGSPLMTISQPSHPSGANRPIGASRPTTSEEVPSDMFRPLITQKIDKLTRGEVIQPPCDRCRRLKLTCIKHLTACQGCTKKHAKCSWKAVTEEEATRIKMEIAVPPILPSFPMDTCEPDPDIEITDREPTVPCQSTPTPTPAGLHHTHRPHSDLVLGPISSIEAPRPESRGGDITGPAAFGAHNILLPPMKVRTALPQGPPQHRRSGTPHSHSSPSPYQTEQRRSWVPQNNPSG